MFRVNWTCDYKETFLPYEFLTANISKNAKGLKTVRIIFLQSQLNLTWNRDAK